MDEVSQQNAALVEQATAAATLLDDQAGCCVTQWQSSPAVVLENPA
jgi:methyl-accepting chemotaxis protein